MTSGHMTVSHIREEVYFMPKDTFFNLPEDKRKRIIDAAIDQFSKLHYSNVTVDNIVTAAGIPKGSFYQYFSNKDDLYVYLFTQYAEKKTHRFEQIKTEIRKLSFREYMLKFIAELKKLEASCARIEKLKQEFLNECPQDIKKQILREELPKSSKIFQEVIQQYIEKGEFRKDLDSKVAAYITIMSISNLEYYPFIEDEDVVEVLHNIINFLVTGMKANTPKNK